MLAHESDSVLGTPLDCKLFIMTSSLNHIETIQFFQDHSFFGAKKENIVFFDQTVLPALSLDGNIILEERGKIVLTPNGNGAVFDAINKLPALQEILRDQVDYLQIISVDNPLNKVLDPVMIGMGMHKDLEIVSKAVTKARPDEKVGNFAVKDGKVAVVEYDEMSEAMTKEKDKNGRLKYNHGSICNFLFKVSKLLDICQDTEQLNQMYHKHLKMVPVWLEELQKSEVPEKENAYKFELYIQNSLGFVEIDKFGLLMVEREEEFAPVKNAPGSDVDSPDTARELLSNLHLKYFSLAGGEFEGEGNFEIDGLVTYAGEGLESYVGKPFKLPGCMRPLVDEKSLATGEL
jgi:UDP-N-acetylglucosamine/UDP-N-acetylgalactosamine diphosphorylase